MFKLERLRAPIYVVFIIFAIPLRSNGVKLNVTNTEDIRLPSKYKNYTDVFSEEEASKFPSFTRVEHSILIKEDVEVPHDSIY
jgi:hypothetical protein